MMRSTRFVLLLGTGLFIGLAGLGAALIDAIPAFGLPSDALHSPPADYQPVGPCQASLGQLYQRKDQQPTSPILIYQGSQLAKLFYIFEDQDIRNGRAWTLLNELGGLPIANVRFSYSQGGNAPRGHPLTTRMRNPHYELWIYLERTGVRSPC